MHAFSYKRIKSSRWGEGDYEVLGGLEFLLGKENKGKGEGEKIEHVNEKSYPILPSTYF